MIYQGRNLNYRAMWEALGVSIRESEAGAFSDLKLCPNPEHDNKRSPAFQVNLTKPLVHCFSRCGVSGSYEHAVQVILGCTPKDARRFIMGFTRVGLGKVDVAAAQDGVRRRKTVESMSALAFDLQRLERGDFTYLPVEARQYLDERGIDQSVRSLWQVGWDEEAERIVIPGRDHRGVARFLIRRAIDGRRPKYLYSDGAVKSEILFGLLHVPKTQRMLVLVEGSVDSIRRQLGGQPAVAILGSGLSDRQVRLISERADQVYTMFDPDEAGVKNTLDAIRRLPRHSVRVCLYPPRSDSDPAKLLHAEARRSLERAIPSHEFLRRIGKLAKTTTTSRR